MKELARSTRGSGGRCRFCDTPKYSLPSRVGRVATRALCGDSGRPTLADRTGVTALLRAMLPPAILVPGILQAQAFSVGPSNKDLTSLGVGLHLETFSETSHGVEPQPEGFTMA